ncbi:hypothetical protein MPNT_340007 [Candidatus Methylacidithermus pantelleriae]|uniref:Uncharacterized protein n=1 Tax=Candidatus Methylacidithermus pantelleriae TaxID=2744239 RepID=A0A8J2BKG7_9BACT|nr:hypothetical protein MPNT_340007 [Candidatus Methylacidithermus pantelleriae]
MGPISNFGEVEIFANLHGVKGRTGSLAVSVLGWRVDTGTALGTALYSLTRREGRVARVVGRGQCDLASPESGRDQAGMVPWSRAMAFLGRGGPRDSNRESAKGKAPWGPVCYLDPTPTWCHWPWGLDDASRRL